MRCIIFIAVLMWKQYEMLLLLVYIRRWGGGGGVLLNILGGGVPPSSWNPDPISDKKMTFSTPVSRPAL